MKYKTICLIMALILMVIYTNYPSKAFSFPEEEEVFRSYWYDYGAEISRFELEQARYGEIHQGHAVLIYVTEPFLPDIQVKADSEVSRQKSIPILKLNFIKRFNTGIYDYSMMKSVFTPVFKENQQYNKTLKVTTTRQDWCGHVFIQYNLNGDNYKVLQNSYFEKEGDRTTVIPAVNLEDEIWTRIRMSPETLPLGEIEMIPGSFFTTLRMTGIGVEKAIAELSNIEDDDGKISKYTITYPSLNRSLSISFSHDFPHDILSWEETYTSGSGENAKELTTRARRTNKLMIDYWNKNSVKDIALRKDLGLPEGD